MRKGVLLYVWQEAMDTWKETTPTWTSTRQLLCCDCRLLRTNDADKRSNYSEQGANLWVCAPSDDDDDEYRGIITVENSDRYRDDFGGTSAATQSSPELPR